MQQPSSVSVARQILRDACEEFGMDPCHVISGSRAPAVVAVRYIAIRRVFFANRSWSLPRVGEFFGRDHTTVLHALRQTDDRLRQMAAKPFSTNQQARARAAYQESLDRAAEQQHEVRRWKTTSMSHKPQLASAEVQYQRRLSQLRHKMAMANRSVTQ